MIVDFPDGSSEALHTSALVTEVKFMKAENDELRFAAYVEGLVCVIGRPGQGNIATGAAAARRPRQVAVTMSMPRRAGQSGGVGPCAMMCSVSHSEPVSMER